MSGAAAPATGMEREMRRYRRMTLIDRVIPFLAAFVGLVGIGGATLVQLNVDQRLAAADQAMTGLKVDIDALVTRLADEPAALLPVAIATDPAAIADPAETQALTARLAALDARIAEMQRIIDGLAAAPAVASTTPADGTPAATGGGRVIDPSWPTTDCIPLGTRFMVTANEDFPICESPAVVRATAISGDNVVFDRAGIVLETASAPIAGTTCTVTVFSAEIDGFAEVRVNCL